MKLSTINFSLNKFYLQNSSQGEIGFLLNKYSDRKFELHSMINIAENLKSENLKLTINNLNVEILKSTSPTIYDYFEILK